MPFQHARFIIGSTNFCVPVSSLTCVAYLGKVDTGGYGITIGFREIPVKTGENTNTNLVSITRGTEEEGKEMYESILSCLGRGESIAVTAKM